jgi:hypothetical protein
MERTFVIVEPYPTDKGKKILHHSQWPEGAGSRVVSAAEYAEYSAARSRTDETFATPQGVAGMVAVAGAAPELVPAGAAA